MGGREIEASQIIGFIGDQEVTIFSSKKKLAVTNCKSSIALSDHLKIINRWYFLCAAISRGFNLKEDLHNYYSNTIAKKWLRYDEDIHHIFKEEINKVDIVISFFSLNSKEFRYTTQICDLLDKPQIVRTTNVIKKLPEDVLNLITGLQQVIHHNTRNAKRLVNQVNHNYTLIDQCAYNEEALIKHDIKLHINTLTFGFIGRLVKGKGGLKVCEVFKEYGIVNKLLIAGSGPEEKVIQENTPQANIHLLGEISGDQLINFYKEIDCLIIASDEETGPLVGVEAMAAGTIIISTDVGAMKDRVGDKAFWFDINNKLSLVQCIKQVKSMNSENILKIKKEMRQLYLSNYSMTAIQKKYRETIL